VKELEFKPGERRGEGTRKPLGGTEKTIIVHVAPDVQMRVWRKEKEMGKKQQAAAKILLRNWVKFS